MGASQSSEPSHSVEPDPEPLEVEEVVEVVEDDLQDPIDDFLESTMKWIFGVS